jgi:hypothetical protein
MKVSRLRLLLIIFWLILAGLIVWLKIVPGGKATYYLSYPNQINFLGGKGFVGNFTPVDRVSINPGETANITGDPVYFSVFTPRTFSQAKVTVTYQDNLSSSTPVIEAGVLVDNIVWRYKLAPLENKILDNSFKDWFRLQMGDTVLLQKNNKYSSIDDFLNNLKSNSKSICGNEMPQSCLALYNTDNLSDYFLNTYTVKSNLEFKPINIPLQGAHQFYFTSSPTQDFKFGFEFADLNLDKKSDPIIISVYKGNTKICSQTFEDNFGGDGAGQVRNSKLDFTCAYTSSVTDLYKLEIKTGEDVVIKKIIKAPSALNIIGRLHPVMSSSLPINFWTDSSFIKLTTNNPASRQNLNFGGNTFELSEPYKQFQFINNNSGLKAVTLNKDDVILENSGIFSFSPADFFNPEFKKIDEHFVLTDKVQYILSNYQSPKELPGGLKQASVILDTKEAYREKGKYSFMISVPGLSLVGSGNLKISKVQVEFSGRTIWDKIKEKFGIYEN